MNQSSERASWMVAVLLVGVGGITFWAVREQPLDDHRLPNANATPSFVLNGETMGTTYTVRFHGPIDVDAKLKRMIDARLELVNEQMSTYRPDSEISRFNRSESTDWFECSTNLVRVVKAAQRIRETTDGAFDATVGPLVNLWSFGPDKRERRVPSDDEVTQVKSFVGGQLLDVRLEPPGIRKQHPKLQLDLSAIAKGFGVDQVAEFLEASGIENYLVEIGGEVRTRGLKADDSEWRIGIERPSESERITQLAASIGDRSMATSGNYRNFFREDGTRYGHTIDPRTGRAVQHNLASVSVVADDCMTADGWATALMVLGEQAAYDLAVRKQLAALFIVATDGDFTVQQTPEFTRLVHTVRLHE
ncbi:MAG: FAD:protein FMN transferase [Planctomycetota bacterium]|nr:FAD:protein FMN transferase [Planctomycetota bacterium]